MTINFRQVDVLFYLILLTVYFMIFFFILFLCFSCLQGAVSLLEMVEFYKTTCKLNLAYNSKIKIRGWQALSRTLKKVKNWHD